MCGLETLAPLMIQAVNDGKITKQQLAAILSENPAKLFNLYPQKGSLNVGTDADITIVDFDRHYKVDRMKFQSISKVTAFDGMEITGKPVRTIVRGTTVMADDKITIDHPAGKFIKA